MIGYSKLKTLYNKDFFEWKRIIDGLEGSLTGAPIDATNTEVPEVTLEENADVISQPELRSVK